jgi:hypothetical protein
MEGKTTSLADLIERMANMKFVGTLIVGFWALTPGYLAMAFFAPDLYSSLDALKLTILAGVYAAVFTAPMGWAIWWTTKRMFGPVLQEITDLKREIEDDSSLAKIKEQLLRRVERVEENMGSSVQFIRCVIIATAASLLWSTLAIAVQYFLRVKSVEAYFVEVVGATLLTSICSLFMSRLTPDIVKILQRK